MAVPCEAPSIIPSCIVNLQSPSHQSTSYLNPPSQRRSSKPHRPPTSRRDTQKAFLESEDTGGDWRTSQGTDGPNVEDGITPPGIAPPQPSAGERGGKESDTSAPPHWNGGDIKELLRRMLMADRLLESMAKSSSLSSWRARQRLPLRRSLSAGPSVLFLLCLLPVWL